MLFKFLYDKIIYFWKEIFVIMFMIYESIIYNILVNVWKRKEKKKLIFIENLIDNEGNWLIIKNVVFYLIWGFDLYLMKVLFYGWW